MDRHAIRQGETLMSRSRTKAFYLHPTVFITAGFAAIIFLTGCSPASSRFDLSANGYSPAESDPGDGRPLVPAETRVDLDQVPLLIAEPVWSQRFADNVHVSISPPGQFVAVTTRGRAAEVYVYDSGGERVWSRSIPGYDKVNARFLHHDGYLGVWVHDQDTKGQYRVYAPDARMLLNIPVRGAVTARMSDDASTLALVEFRTLRLLDMSGKTVATHQVRQGASVRFIPGSPTLLVEDEQEILVLSSDGRVLDRYDLRRQLTRAVVPSPDGTLIAVSTGLGDNALHMLGIRGEEVWKYLLLPGGSNDVLFSPDGDLLLVYNVGRRGGLYLFDANSGMLLWRTSLDIDISCRLVTWRDAAFTGAGSHIVGHLGIRDTSRGEVSEESSLVIISMDGCFVARVTLGFNLEVALGRDGALLAVADGAPSPWSYVQNTVHFFDLRQALEPAGEESDD